MTSGAKFERLVEIMATLRGPNGCPWDKEQNLDTLKPMLVEEVYEVLEAVDNRDYDGIAEELGDLLLHIVFHARLGEEASRFAIGRRDRPNLRETGPAASPCLRRRRRARCRSAPGQLGSDQETGKVGTWSDPGWSGLGPGRHSAATAPPFIMRTRSRPGWHASGLTGRTSRMYSGNSRKR